MPDILCLSLQAATGSPSQPQALGKRKKLAVESVFNRFDDDEVDEAPRKRKLVPLDYEDEDKNSVGVEGAGAPGGKGANTEEKRKHIKSLIEKIPTAKPELFNYPLDWSVVDSVSIDEVSTNLVLWEFDSGIATRDITSMTWWQGWQSTNENVKFMPIVA